MKNKKIIILGFVIASFLFISFNDLEYFKLNKNFEIFGAVFKEVNKSYVNEVDNDVLFDKAINALLDELDPYTVYYQEDNKDDIEMITNGHYVGFGITIRKMNNQVTVTGISDDFMSYENGLRVGDILYKIDENLVINLESDELKKYTQGTSGSIADVKVIRQKDTISLKLERHQVDVKNISYYGMISDSIGYIKLERFSFDADNDFRKSYFELINNNSVKGLVIDLRDNPGGLLQAALNICEMFVPKGSILLSTKGRMNVKNYTYKSYTEPIDLKTPICVIINENSASASEIVAGCLQDHDRAIVTGKQSFGKGLVQSVLDLPYNATLKITTAKYYTPSGRCIQRIEYGKDKNSEKSDSVFYTSLGRKVYESKGISPDSVLEQYQYNEYTRKLYNSDAFFNFSNEYLLDKNIELYYEISEEDLDQFKSYLSKKSLLNVSKSSESIEKLYEFAADEKILEDIEYEIDVLSAKISKLNKKMFEQNKSEIKKLLDYEFKRRYYNSEHLSGLYKDKDSVIIKSIDLLMGQNYNKILSSPEKNDDKQ